MMVWLVEFSNRKLERFLSKNQHNQFLKFENWCSGELSKVWHHFGTKVILELIIKKKVNYKKCGPRLVFFNKEKMRKIRMIFDIEN